MKQDEKDILRKRLYEMALEVSRLEGRARGFEDHSSVDRGFGLYQKILLVTSKTVDHPSSHSVSRVTIAREHLDELTNRSYRIARTEWRDVVRRRGGSEFFFSDERDFTERELSRLSDELDKLVGRLPRQMQASLFARFAVIESSLGSGLSREGLVARGRQLEVAGVAGIDEDDRDLAALSDDDEEKDSSPDDDDWETGSEFGQYEPDVWDLEERDY